MVKLLLKKGSCNCIIAVLKIDNSSKTKLYLFSALDIGIGILGLVIGISGRNCNKRVIIDLTEVFLEKSNGLKKFELSTVF